MAMVIMLGLLLLFAIIGIPLAFAIGASGLSYLMINAPKFLVMMPQRIWSGTFSYIMVCMPLFIFMGELMNEADITKRLLDVCEYLVRPVRGGLGEVNVIASMIFGGISGSSVADTSCLGSVLIPEMEKRGYSPEFASGITVASSTMGMVIPPSIPMIMFSMISGASIGALFMAGLIPGILVGLGQIVVCFVISRKRGYHPARQAFDMKHFVNTMVYGIPAVIMPILLVLSISFGICTASESAAVAVAYSLLLGVCLYRKLTIKKIIAALRRTMISSASIAIIIGFSAIFTWILTMMKVPQTVAAFVVDLNMPKWALLIFMDVLILFLGTFIDVSPAILMLTPILLPIMRAYGVNDWQFAAMFIVGLAIGLVTPPVGMCLNVCNKINGMSITKIAKAAFPFIVINISVLVAISFIPELTCWLPAIMNY